MSTIANLLSLIDPSAIKPYSEGVESVNRAERGRQLNQTGLIELAELKRQQEAQQLARQYYQQHPEALMGPGGGPVLASLQTAPGGPGGGMPGQDPARYAGVSPQGGGPIPPDVARQVMPQVTPPGGMPGGPPQGALGTQPQPQANPLMALMRQNPDAAFAVMQQQQQQQDAALKRDEQRLTMGTKVAEYVGRVAQGVTSQETLEQARQELARIHPQAAAQLPQTYSKEAMVPFVKRAVGVADNARLQLETWQRQIEEQKLGVQLAQAGFTGLSDDVTSILKGYTEAQVQQFGGRTSPAAIQNAVQQAREQKPVPGQTADVTTELRAMNKDPWKAQAEDLQQARKNIEERELTRTKAAEIQRGQTERELRGDKTVSEVMGTKATNLFDTQTGETGNIAKMKIKDYEALPEGRVKELSPRLTEQMENINISVPIVSQLQEHIDKIYGPGGVLARMSVDERTMLTNAPSQWAKQYAQKYPELIQAQRFIDANKSNLSRALAGEKGSLSGDDVERAGALLPNLETALKVWPPTEIGWRQPDTKDVALRSMNSIVDMINARGRTLLGNEQYAHPKLHRYETAQEVEKTGGDPQAQPTLNAPAPPIPPLVGPNPNLPKVRQPGEIPVLGGPGMPEQYLPAPGKQSQAAPAPAPAPSAPAAKPTPGRQLQAMPGRRAVELARASGIKVMDAQDIRDAMEATGRSRAEVIKAARQRGYTVHSGGGTAMA